MTKNKGVVLAVLLMLVAPVSTASQARADAAAECKQLINDRQYDAAFPSCWQSAEQGVAVAQYNLGGMYFSGQGVAQDNAEAAKWYRKAAEQNFAAAQYNMGLMYAFGRGVAQDDAEAVKWHRKAAEQNFAAAQYQLGFMYSLGRGAPTDKEKTVAWWRKAAEQGDADAQFAMGVTYSYGEGVIRSDTVAADWYYKAGLSFLKNGNRDKALMCVDFIKVDVSTPNAFLGDKLLKQIYDGDKAQASPTHREEQSSQKMVSGTGWWVKGGFVVTNHHVVAGHTFPDIKLLFQNGWETSGTIIAEDPSNDLALLLPFYDPWDTHIETLPSSLPLATAPAQIGEQVFTVGFPHPDLMGTKPKLTQGIVNARTGVADDPRVYQISVPLQGGNSGGPLLNMKGEVVGVVTAKLNAAKVFKWTGDLPQNVNYAVKFTYVRALLESTDAVSINVQVLPARKGSLEELAKRVNDSVVMINVK